MLSTALNGNPSQSYKASPAIWDYIVLPATWHSCHPTQVEEHHLNPSQTGAETRFTYLGEMEGWVDLAGW